MSSFSLNKLHLVGRLGHDPEMRYTPRGTAVTTLSVATDRPSQPGEPAETDWHRVVCWDALAERANQYGAKGRLVYVAGRLQYRTYEGRDGHRQRAAEVVASELGFLDRRPGADAPAEPEPPADETPGA
jgi:single-strand DNA-binding protein